MDEQIELWIVTTDKRLKRKLGTHKTVDATIFAAERHFSLHPDETGKTILAMGVTKRGHWITQATIVEY